MAQGTRAGTQADLQASGQLRTKVGTLPGRRVLARRRARTRSRTAARTSGSRSTREPSSRGSSPATGTTHASISSRAARSTCGPTTRAGFDVEIADGDVFVRPRAETDVVGHLQRRLREGLEEDISLVMAKSVLGLLDAGVDPGEIVRTGVEFGARYRESGWGAGLTTLIAMANLLPHLARRRPSARARTRPVFVARDTRGRAPRFPVGPLTSDGVPVDRLARWYSRFVETRASDAAERVLETTLVDPDRLPDAEAMMFAAVTDHVFIDEGHTIDFTNKAFEALDYLDADAGALVLPTLVGQTAQAQRSEEFSEWRHPHDLVALADSRDRGTSGRARRRATRAARSSTTRPWPRSRGASSTTIRTRSSTRSSHRCAPASTTSSSVERSRTRPRCASLASTSRTTTPTGTPSITRSPRRTRSTTRCNATRHRRCAAAACTPRSASTSTASSTCPAARPPRATTGDLDALAQCFEVQGGVDDAGNEAYGFLRAGGSRAELIAALGHALLVEDAEFHWFQTVEAGIRQAEQWPERSEESALVLAGVARFLAAHTPTRRELPTVVRIATRLRRGEALYEDDGADEPADVGVG